ncbi:MAG: hypothetical protein H6737_13650 [Alphaproteobacteria bacterium]|nr:hypothetical protein [Alphaproteobacteria bacterium]
MTQRALTWSLIAVASGAAALAYESVWLRRLSVVLGGSAIAAAWTLGVFMLGLALGGLAAQAAKGDERGVPRTYAALETFAALWALAFPFLLDATPVSLAALLPLPAAVALGATWPVLARSLPASGALTLYAANTTGAVVGVLLTTFATLPSLGLRGAEIVAACTGLGAAAVAVAVGPWGRADPAPPTRPPWSLLAAAGIAGFVALGLEVVWMRLASVALGATVQTMGLVLAVFLATIAVGSAVGRTWPRDPANAAAGGLVALGGLSLVGAISWPFLPYALGIAYGALGPERLWIGNAILAALWMAGAPAASGLAFSGMMRLASRDTTGSASAWLYGVNSVGSMAGALLGGLVLLPELEPRATVGVLAILAAAGAGLVGDRRWIAAPIAIAAIAALLPSWDAKLYAVGVHLRVSDFADPSPAAIARYANDNWELEHYDHGATAAVAVGRSLTTNNVWLSINGKFDASTGDDMPTQVLSGEIPVAAARSPSSVAVVGLASGVTAGAVLRDPRVGSLVIFELEPAVVRASHFFDHVNGRPLDDPRTTLLIDDARAVLTRDPRRYDVIVSEPSNPWISGISSLFTREYWALGRARLNDGGVFCQWVQLYGMGPEQFRGIVRTFASVFGDVWLYETIPGSDVLLVAGAPPPPDAPVQPTLDPDGVRRLAGQGWLNTDDHPRVEWEAPQWLHYATAADNAALIEAAR